MKSITILQKRKVLWPFMWLNKEILLVKAIKINDKKHICLGQIKGKCFFLLFSLTCSSCIEEFTTLIVTAVHEKNEVVLSYNVCYTGTCQNEFHCMDVIIFINLRQMNNKTRQSIQWVIPFIED